MKTLNTFSRKQNKPSLCHYADSIFAFSFQPLSTCTRILNPAVITGNTQFCILLTEPFLKSVCSFMPIVSLGRSLLAHQLSSWEHVTEKTMGDVFVACVGCLWHALFLRVLQTRRLAQEQNRTDIAHRLFVMFSRWGVLSVPEETSHTNQVDTVLPVNPGLSLAAWLALGHLPNFLVKQGKWHLSHCTGEESREKQTGLWSWAEGLCISLCLTVVWCPQAMLALTLNKPLWASVCA